MVRKETSAVLEAVEKVVIREFNLPSIGPEEALLKVEAAGVCGTDSKIYYGKFLPCSFPIILGHEIVGRIEEIGEAASKKYGVRRGDRVVVEERVRCGYCIHCIMGNYKFCDKAIYYGMATCSKPPHLWGAYGQFMYIAPGSVVCKISEEVPTEAAVLVNAVIANGIQWVRNLGKVSIGDAVAILGVGPQGLSAVIAAKESGASPIIALGLSIDAQRLELARLFGADFTINVEKENAVERVKEITGGRMADLVIDVTGSPSGVAFSLDLPKSGGTVVSAGVTGTGVLTPLATDKIVFKEIRFQGALSKQVDAILRAVRLVESKKYPVEKMVTHRYNLQDAESALQAVGKRIEGVYPIKAMLLP